MVWAVGAAALLMAGSASSQPLVEHPLLEALAAQVSADREQATDARLVAFGTRNSLSETDSASRGIGAARRWVAAQFAALSQGCAGCLRIETPSQTLSGARVPAPTPFVDVLAVQTGTTDPGRVVVISAHLDSRASDVMDAKIDAPGANDDGSGVSAVLEAARVLSAHRFPATIVYAVLSGEEQGLYGGKVLADHAVAQGWRIEADLNNDIIGNIRGQDGTIDNTHVRVFSEGGRTNETPAQAATRHDVGGELDSPSRNIARFMQQLAAQYLNDLEVRMIYRPDRSGRGGDQREVLNQGFPAVRVTEAQENYTRQHQTVRVENGVAYGDVIDGVDFPYLAKVTRLNVITLAALASAPEPPRGLTLSGAVTPDTTLNWTRSPGATAYRAWWRETTEPQWRYSRLARQADRTTLEGVNIDDWFFGVSAVGADGYESPVAFPGVSGSFDRLPPVAPPAPLVLLAPAK
jgi:acetylornithine deacetylase/succinyl-diaminopimelate desuccinylase-like protein